MSRLKEPNSVTGLLPQYRPEDRAYHVFRIVFYLIRCNDLIADDALRAIFEKTFIDLYCAEALRSTATFDELINLPIRKMALKSYMKSTFGFYAKGIAALRNDDKKGLRFSWITSAKSQRFRWSIIQSTVSQSCVTWLEFIGISLPVWTLS